ncbi:hypothetical protein AM493_10365 [Flavobacterium akiainvivens]|uniref:Uncharacterized protein n=1 Tax=Flavobacterium akiainvivens TaxID=1202724 RepID=A0A0M8MIQ4_9FLAO|nr:hypothetical protein [Flavobacterium akiainvivens]KOS06388.1 hypothetical protein AM493_10365 [Flavobacterium akiainvivens]SFQ14630.1 hypothetical protein SAMN05444144_101289 [Flavobacterium akiainvivens]
MAHTKIKLAYRVVIDHTATQPWDRYIFEDTYREYLMQHQLFNDKDNPKTTFRELLAENPKTQQLHFLTGMAAESYVAQLKGSFYRVPDVLGTTYLPFTTYRLDIVNTDITDMARHKVGITFYSPLFTYLGIVNNCYLVSSNTNSEAPGLETLMFPVQPLLAICYYEDANLKPL